MNYREYREIKWDNVIGFTIFNFVKQKWYSDEDILKIKKRNIKSWEILSAYKKYLSNNNIDKKYSLDIFSKYYHLSINIEDKKHYKNRKKRKAIWLRNEEEHILRLYSKHNYSIREIANIYKCSPNSITNIINNRWRNNIITEDIILNTIRRRKNWEKLKDIAEYYWVHSWNLSYLVCKYKKEN